MDGYWFFCLIKRTLYKNSSQPRAIILYRTPHICETNFKAFWKSHYLPNLSKKKPRQIYFNLLWVFLVCILINFYFVCYSMDLFCLILWSNVTLLSYLVLYYWFFFAISHYCSKHLPLNINHIEVTNIYIYIYENRNSIH